MDIWDITQPGLEAKTYGVVIPFGSEGSFGYKSYPVIEHIAKRLKARRLVIVTRGTGTENKDDSVIRKQLICVWRCFFFDGCIPAVTIQFPIVGILNRKELETVPLSSGATAIVQDHQFEGGTVRQLVFDNQIEVIQSAVVVESNDAAKKEQLNDAAKKEQSNDAAKKEQSNDVAEKTEEMPADEKGKMVKKTTGISANQNSYERLVSTMLEACEGFEKKKAPRLLLLGLGGGAMASAVLKQFPSTTVVAVEKEQEIVRVGKRSRIKT